MFHFFSCLLAAKPWLRPPKRGDGNAPPSPRPRLHPSDHLALHLRGGPRGKRSWQEARGGLSRPSTKKVWCFKDVRCFVVQHCERSSVFVFCFWRICGSFIGSFFFWRFGMVRMVFAVLAEFLFHKQSTMLIKRQNKEPNALTPAPTPTSSSPVAPWRPSPSALRRSLCSKPPTLPPKAPEAARAARRFRCQAKEPLRKKGRS